MKKRTPRSLPYELGAWAHVFAPRARHERRHWLLKSEPEVFSFADLMAAPERTSAWDGVRNSTARNFMRDGMKRGDLAFFYHSNAEPSAIVGICEIVREGYPDPTALDPQDGHYDPRSDRDAPTWFMVDVRAVRALPRPVSLAELKATPALATMALLRQGRLSVVPVSVSEWKAVLALAGAR